MKTVSARDLQRRVRECVEVSQKEHVIVTRHGRPAAVLVGVEGQDWEDLVLQTSPGFWRMIERRRRQKTVPLREVRRRLETRRRSRRPRRGT
ncbi:MAG: type II toxin-antitoxin system Phd/YefM family antitoxin [Armatimonadota bacterium]